MRKRFSWLENIQTKYYCFGINKVIRQRRSTTLKSEPSASYWRTKDAECLGNSHVRLENKDYRSWMACLKKAWLHVPWKMYLKNSGVISLFVHACLQSALTNGSREQSHSKRCSEGNGVVCIMMACYVQISSQWSTPSKPKPFHNVTRAESKL